MTLDEAINLMNTAHKGHPKIPLTSSKHPFSLEQLLGQGMPLDAIAEIMLAPDGVQAQDRYRNYFTFKGGI